ncbi:glycosyltransferase 87 family protein [Allostreptomyces psammosilenae]|uniref:DUF2029 domain-containing protein n=1 Tax=Allostreptomyces psammosilenae TaxID=1892865 RepID=A0A853A7K7_9ACTN|nr:glycosyltransferase 87 family protein [Allostreptomyces psammosilenae]NYI06651.1 hypothetical protein [Allostreptomyces psammosilenae]
MNADRTSSASPASTHPDRRPAASRGGTAAGRPPRQGRPWLLPLLLLLAVVAGLTVRELAGASLIDARVYQAQGEALVAGTPLYEVRATALRLPATYPPFGAMLFVPLAAMGPTTLAIASYAANAALLAAFVWLSLRLVLGERAPRGVRAVSWVLGLSAAAIFVEPVWTTLGYGQVNLLIGTLVLWDFTRRPGHPLTGLGTGLATGIKLTPALFVFFLACCAVVAAVRAARDADPGRAARLRAQARSTGRAALTSVAVFLGTVALGFAALPSAAVTFWTDLMFSADRVGRVEDSQNQSLRGAAARLLHTVEPGISWQVAAVLVAAVGLAAAVALALRSATAPPGAPAPGRPSPLAWAVVACALVGLLVSPVSWTHHWVWCVPLGILLVVEARARRGTAWWALTGVTAVVFLAQPTWRLPHYDHVELSQTPPEMVIGSAYVLLALGMLGLCVRLALRPRRPRAAGSAPAAAPESSATPGATGAPGAADAGGGADPAGRERSRFVSR